MDKPSANLKKLFAKSVYAALQDEHHFSLKQSEEIVNAAGPGRALRCVEWLTTLLEEHPPGILGLVLTTSLSAMDIHGVTVRMTLKELYGMTLPSEAYTTVSMRYFIAGALQILLAKAQRGDFGKDTAQVFDPPVRIYRYDPQSDTMDSTLTSGPGSLRHTNGGENG